MHWLSLSNIHFRHADDEEELSLDQLNELRILEEKMLYNWDKHMYHEAC